MFRCLPAVILGQNRQAQKQLLCTLSAAALVVDLGALLLVELPLAEGLEAVVGLAHLCQ
jgi:hypothetical protein